MSRHDTSDLERALGVDLHDRQLLYQALVHKSYVNERPDLKLGSNERLEFLGDAVLGAVVAHFLYEAYPQVAEGDLTMLRAGLVRMSTLAEWANRVNLGRYLLLGKGEEQGGGRERVTLLARAFEAVVGAVYLDQGYEFVSDMLRPFILADSELTPGGRPVLDPKSRFQQVAQARFEITPQYEVVDVTGPGHSPIFRVRVTAGEHIQMEGTGRTKQAAQQAAAQAALDQLTAQPDDEPGGER